MGRLRRVPWSGARKGVPQLELRNEGNPATSQSTPNMFRPIIRNVAVLLIGVMTFMLALGAVLYRAASVTGADSDYTIQVSWFSVLTSVLWPPTRMPLLPLAGVVVLGAFAALMFFRAPRFIGAFMLLLQAVVGYYSGGWLGWFFLSREFGHYHFNMDGEKLGENWFSFECLIVWTLASTVLAFLRIFTRKHSTETQS